MGNGTRKTGGSSSRFDTPTKSTYLNGSTAGSSTSYFTPLSAANGSSRRQLQGGFLVPGSAQAVSKPTGQPVRNNRRVQGEREEDYTYTTVYDGFNGPKERKKDPVKTLVITHPQGSIANQVSSMCESKFAPKCRSIRVTGCGRRFGCWVKTSVRLVGRDVVNSTLWST